MEIHELRQQEDLEKTLVDTLAPAWSEEFGRPVQIELRPTRGQAWVLQPRLSTFFVREASHAVRSFMVERFRFTPVTARVPLQWTLGTILGSRGATRLLKPSFWVDPPIEGARDRLIVPGSRRIRTFDLAAGKTRSILKAGFRSDAIATEIEVRSHPGGPFLPITASDPDGTRWFEEDVVSGFPLPRVPTWWNRATIERTALETLTAWLEANVTETATDEHVGRVAANVRTALAEVERRFPGSADLPTSEELEKIEFAARDAGKVPTAQTHGDFQPGNIHVSRTDRQPILIDWEFSDRRGVYYDLLTYGLRARYPEGFGHRLTRFVSSAEAGPATPFLADREDPQWRRHVSNLFLLEELDRAATETISATYTAPPLGFRIFCREMRSIGWASAAS